MQNRYSFWRIFSVILALIALSITTFSAAEENVPDVKKKLNSSSSGTISVTVGNTNQAKPNDSGATTASVTAGNSAEDPNKVIMKKPVLYQRSNYVWPYLTGPYYGEVPPEFVSSPYYLKTMVGSFDTRSGLFDIPGELKKGILLQTTDTMQYFIAQFNPDYFDYGKFEVTRKEFENLGVQFFDYLSNRAHIVLLNSSNYPIVASSPKIQFLEPYHPALKIAPNVGKIPLPDPVAAISPVYSLVVMLFPNEPAIVASQKISQMGGMIKFVYGNTIYVDIDRSKIGEIASLEAVRGVFEVAPHFPHGEETTTVMQTGDYNEGAVPYFDVGVDGGGGGGIANPQYLQVVDTGASYDAGDLSNTRSDPGYPADPTIPNPSHRKIYLYKTTGSWGGSGDYKSCDDVASGGYTHGQVVSATALGNASDVDPSYGEGWYFYDSNDNPWKIDGVAKGAKLLFYDDYITPASGACDEGGSPTKSFYGGTPGSGILGDGYSNGARGTNYSFGSDSQVYDAHPQQIDEFLFENQEAMVFISAGNSSSDTNADGTADERTIGSPANSKNAIVVGGSGNAGYTNWRADFSSVGPVGSTSKPRVAPLLMAPAVDYGLQGISSEYSCKSQDNDQTGTVVCNSTNNNSGTSFSSPAAMGASAIVRDYFAQGFYPDGTSSDAGNDADKVPVISGALVKAILIASAEFMDGAYISKKYRFNNEIGYGRIELRNVLPLITDPSTPVGLIIDDQGLSTGQGISPNDSVIIEFQVTDTTIPLKAAVAWIDGTSTSPYGEDLINDLDLELWFDSNGNGSLDSNEHLYWGNYFTEDKDKDGTLDSGEDNDGDGTIDQSEWSLEVKNSGANASRDTFNVNEGIFVSTSDLARDNNSDGTIDEELSGTWILKISAKLANLEAQKYAAAIAGGCVAGSSIRFDKSPVVCNDIVHVIVNEVDEAGDPGSGLTPSVISGRTTVYVIDPGPDRQIDTTDDVTVDTETGISFIQQGAALKFKSEDLPTSSSSTQGNNNGILDLEDGYYLKAVYQDVSDQRFSMIKADCTVRLQSGTKIWQWGRNYAYYLDGGCEVNGIGRSLPDKYPDKEEKIVYWIAILNGEGTDLVDLEAELRAVVPDSDNNDDPGRLNNSLSSFINILNPQKVVGKLDSGSAMIIPFEIEVVGNPTFPSDKIEMVLGISATKNGKSVKEYQAFSHQLDADDEVLHFSTDFPTGGTVTKDYDNNEYVGPLDTGKKQGGQLDAPGEDFDLWYERVQFDDMTTTAYGGGNPGFNGPWDFNTNGEDFRTGIHPKSTEGTNYITNWGEDKNFNDILDTGEDREPADDTLSQNWANKGGCGFQTKGSEPEAWKGGAWHTGTIFNDQQTGQVGCLTPTKPGGAIKCQPYETRSGTNNADYWKEFLKTPDINKVHVNNDANGFSYYVEFGYDAVQWNQQVDLNDTLTVVTWELDTDTESDDEISFIDDWVFNGFSGKMGLKSGGNGNLIDGFSAFAPSNAVGDQTNGTVGNNRVGRRGCAFEDLTADQRDQPHGLAKPPDDDADNDCDWDSNGDGTINSSDCDGSTDEFVTANGPYKNFGTGWPRTNGLRPGETFEDYYGDSGKKFAAAFGFWVYEGSQSNTPVGNGYGLAIDDVAIEWDEMHPIADQTDCSTNGQCASMSIKTIYMYEGLSLVPVSILDVNAETTQGVGPTWDKDDTSSVDIQDADSDGLKEIRILAYSEAEPNGEYFWLEQKASGSFEYTGNVPISTGFDEDGVIFVKVDGTDLPTLYIKYVDKSDGVHVYNHGTDGCPGKCGVDDDKYGPDGAPGSKDYDDDGDGTVDEADEWCMGPGGTPVGDDDCDNLTDEADEHCPLAGGGYLRPYGDDNCGCPINPIFYGSSISYPVGRMSVELVTIVDDNGDHDGFADQNETVTMEVTLRNLARAEGEFIDLTNVVAKIQASDLNNDGTINVDCITDSSGSYGDIPKREARTNSTDRFQFQVKDVNRSGVYQDLDAEFLLTVTSNEIDGTYMPLKITVPLDLDASGGSADHITWTAGFESGESKFEFVRVAAADGQRCQYNDPANPNSNSYGRENCNIDTVFLDQDWHIHDTSASIPSNSRRAYLGSNSLHWGYHENPASASGDTEHLAEMNIARTINHINLGLNDATNKAILSFKQQCSLLDSRGTNTPWMETADRAVVMVARTDASGNVQGNWIKIFPFTNVYNFQGTDNFVNCLFDPTDDGSTEDDFFPNSLRLGPSSTCFPEFAFSWMGETNYRATFDPEDTGNGDGPGLQGSSGPGTWVESKFNLERLQGYRIKLRFLATSIENYPMQTGTQLGYSEPYTWFDDGWYIDDVKITNTVTTAFTMSPDADTPPAATCPLDPSQNCTTITPDIKCADDGVDNDQDGTIDETGEDNCKLLAPGHKVTLTSSGTSADKCVDGTFQYQWWIDNDGDGTIEGTDTMLYDWSDRYYYFDAPTADTWYCVKAVCSSDKETCIDTACVLVDVYEGCFAEICDGLDNDCDGTVDNGLTFDVDADGHSTPDSCAGTKDDCDDNDNTVYPGATEICDSKDNDCDVTIDEGALPLKVTGLAFLSKNKNTFGWNAALCGTAYDTVKGDLKLLRSTKGDFSTTVTGCLENDDTDTQATDTNNPPANGEGFYYLTRAVNSYGNGTYNTETAKQIGDRDAEINSDPESCP
ncbi:MAG: MopE-related protein [Acidobacteriota bacterium]